MEVAAAWGEARVGLKKSDNRKSIYMIMGVVAALAVARVGVKRCDSRKSIYMGLDEGDFEAGGSRVGLFCLPKSRLVVFVLEHTCSVCSRAGFYCLF